MMSKASMKQEVGIITRPMKLPRESKVSKLEGELTKSDECSELLLQFDGLERLGLSLHNKAVVFFISPLHACIWMLNV